jgi:hypothetical protein
LTLFSAKRSFRSSRNPISARASCVVAAFDGAALYSTDPREVSRLATQAVAHLQPFNPPLAKEDPSRN